MRGKRDSYAEVDSDDDDTAGQSGPQLGAQASASESGAGVSTMSAGDVAVDLGSPRAGSAFQSMEVDATDVAVNAPLAGGAGLRPAHVEEEQADRRVTSSYQRLCLILVGAGALALVIVLLAVPRRPPPNSGTTADPAKHIESVPDGHRALILVSMDGFRWDYLDGRAQTPNFDRFTSHGVRASAMRPVFPSKTFPNHYSIVTGLYPESHGIIGNRMYDPVFDEIYTISGPQAVQGKWYGGEPIWVTAEKQGVKAGCMFWPGSEAEIKGTRPTYYRKYDGSVSFNSRVDQVVDWLLLPPEQRPQLVTMYLSSPDHEGHMYGPGSQQVVRAVETVDGTLGYLLDKLDEYQMRDYVDIIVTADHGMAEVRQSRVVYLEDYIDLTQVEIVTWSPVLGIIPHEPVTAAEIVANLTAVPHMQAWLKENVPERLHYQHNRRIPPVVGLADDEWTIEDTRRHQSWYGNGAHGFDNELDDMHAIFTASGPQFKQQYFAGAVKNLDIYPLACHLLGLSPAPNNGSLSAIRHVLRSHPDAEHQQP